MPTMPLVFDRASFLRRMMSDWDLCVEVLGDFLEDLPNQLDALARHQAAGELAAVAQRAHTIKGASANVSAEALREAALAVELAALEEKRSDLPALCENLLFRAEQARIALEIARQS